MKGFNLIDSVQNEKKYVAKVIRGKTDYLPNMRYRSCYIV